MDGKIFKLFKDVVVCSVNNKDENLIDKIYLIWRLVEIV